MDHLVQYPAPAWTYQKHLPAEAEQNIYAQRDVFDKVA